MTEIIFTAISIYLICGAFFAIAFIFKGVSTVDESAKGSSVGFKIIILPGTIVFWPLLLRKWIRSAKDRSHD